MGIVLIAGSPESMSKKMDHHRNPRVRRFVLHKGHKKLSFSDLSVDSSLGLKSDCQNDPILLNLINKTLLSLILLRRWI